MDTSTVVQIIAMLDNKIRQLVEESEDAVNLSVGMVLQHEAVALIEFRDHLQEYIEAQLSIAENSTGE
jgi:exoribonuclease R